jgi:hypothetical protein
MKLSFEKINKFVLLLALVSLVYRKGNFSVSHIPKPYELILFLLLLLTGIYILFGKKIKYFFTSIPKNILIAISVLVFSVLLGWTVGAKIAHMPNNPLTILEFGTFGISIASLVMVLFYTNKDEKYANWYLYALLLPNLHVIYFFITHGLVGYFATENDGSLDFTLNPNVLSKILLIPALFFISRSLFEFKNKNWRLMTMHVGLSLISVMLIFWSISRAAILSLVLGSIFTLIVFSFFKFDWKKLTGGAFIMTIIFCLGFIILPSESRDATTRKVTKTVSTVANLDKSNAALVAPTPGNPSYVYEPRLIVWAFFPKYALLHPLGVGPATHGDFGVYDKQGKHIIIGPDNTYLLVWVWGGLLAITSFLYLLFCAFKSIYLRLKRDFNANTFALSGILCALSIAIFFDGNLALYWFFIILALSLRQNDNTSSEHSSA